MKLLTRDRFREAVLTRNSVCCVPDCSQPAVDAHHILNRNLFTAPNQFGGYFLENGAGLCDKHHYETELTFITPEQLRVYCGIIVPVLPHNMNPDTQYDCWGNIIVSDWVMAPGPLFNDEGCRKALTRANKLWMFPSP